MSVPSFTEKKHRRGWEPFKPPEKGENRKPMILHLGKKSQKNAEEEKMITEGE